MWNQSKKTVFPSPWTFLSNAFGLFFSMTFHILDRTHSFVGYYCKGIWMSVPSKLWSIHRSSSSIVSALKLSFQLLTLPFLKNLCLKSFSSWVSAAILEKEMRFLIHKSVSLKLKRTFSDLTLSQVNCHVKHFSPWIKGTKT